MDQQQEIIEKIKRAHQEYSKKMAVLRHEQRQVVDDLVRELEKTKIAEIKKSLEH